MITLQFESLAGFSAIVDRLGQFQEAMVAQKPAALPATSSPDAPSSASSQAEQKSEEHAEGDPLFGQSRPLSSDAGLSLQLPGISLRCAHGPGMHASVVGQFDI